MASASRAFKAKLVRFLRIKEPGVCFKEHAAPLQAEAMSLKILTINSFIRSAESFLYMTRRMRLKLVLLSFPAISKVPSTPDRSALRSDSKVTLHKWKREREEMRDEGLKGSLSFPRTSSPLLHMNQHGGRTSTRRKHKETLFLTKSGADPDNNHVNVTPDSEETPGKMLQI